MKPPLDPNAIGKVERSTDPLSENEADQIKNDTKLLQWLEESVPEHPVEAKSQNRLRELLDAGLQLGGNHVSAISALKGAKYQGMFLDRLVDVLKDIFYAGKDLVSSNRVKTSLTILGGIVVGAAIGSVVPGIGTAIGGVVGASIGASITSGIAAIGGTLGFGILGAFGGSWVAKKISDKAFKHEKRFEISKRVTRKIKKRIGISSDVVQMINGYLYNRSKVVSSHLAKKYYKSLRRLAIFEADPTAMEKVARFFCNELMLLDGEMQNSPNEALNIDLKAVVYILKKLKAAQGLSLESKNSIDAAFKAYEQTHIGLPTIKLKQGVEYDSKKEISPEMLDQAKVQFVDTLPKLGISEAFPVNKRINEKGIRYRYYLKTEKGESLPEVVFKGKSKGNHYQTSVKVNANQLTSENTEQVIEVIMAQAKAYERSTGNDEVVVKAAGDDDFAIRLMVAVLQANMKPTLDDVEYPENSPKREQILEKVKILTQQETFSSRPKNKPDV